MNFDFIVTGFPGSATMFWSFALTQGDTSFCYHEWDENKGGGNISSELIGDSNSLLLLLEGNVRSKKYVIVERDRDEAYNSFTRRYRGTDNPSAAMLFDIVSSKCEALKKAGEKTLVVPYEKHFSEDTIRKVFTHCTGKQIQPRNLHKLMQTNITTFDIR